MAARNAGQPYNIIQSIFDLRHTGYPPILEIEIKITEAAKSIASHTLYVIIVQLFIANLQKSPKNAIIFALFLICPIWGVLQMTQTVRTSFSFAATSSSIFLLKESVSFWTFCS